ncbi:hypothetical protein [Massilia timonae]|uniref:hypothetical protein n=1 Tax=Massilia timonae TaxID=47229 RepID=UPI00289BAE32|nr:hypothetical protein [Massilia timonae]
MSSTIRNSDEVTEREIYIARVKDLQTLLRHSLKLHQTLPQPADHELALQYSQAVYFKFLTHGVSLLNLLPDGPSRAGKAWDLSSASALSRCMIEAFEALAYISLHSVSQEEQTFRIKLWRAHDCERRLQMMKLVPIDAVKISTCSTWLDDAREELSRCSFFKALDLPQQKKLLKELPAYHISHEEICRSSNIDFEYYRLSKMMTSQHVHTASFAIHHLDRHIPASEEGYRNMTMAITPAVVFLAKAIVDLRVLYGLADEELDSNDAEVLSEYLPFLEGLRSWQAGSRAGA